MTLSGEVTRVLGQVCGFLIAYVLCVWMSSQGLWDDPIPMPAHVKVVFTVVCVVCMVCVIFQDQFSYCIWWLLSNGPFAPLEVVPQQGM